MKLNAEILKRIGIGAACLVAGFLVGTFVLTIPVPTVTDARSADGFAVVKGTTRSNAAVIAFDNAGTYLKTVLADARGAFAFDALPSATGTSYIIRVMDGGWRASPPRKVSVSAVPVESPVGVTGEELPPGVPPTSSAWTANGSATTTSSASSTQDAETPKVIIAIASVSNMNPKAGSNIRVTADVRDEAEKPIAGAIVSAILRYPSGPVTVALKGDGPYGASVKIPDKLASGTMVVVDVTAAYLTLASTARAAFTVK